MSMNLGINLVEVDGATPSIQGAPTSVAGFVVRSQRGVPGLVVQVSNFSQFTDQFGGYVADGNEDGTQTSYVGAYAIRGFFDNGGTLAYVYRVVDQASAEAASASFSLAIGSPDTALTLTAAFRGQADPGVWGNSIAIAIVPNTSNPSITDAFDVTVAQVTGTTYKTLETWTKLSLSGAPGYRLPQVLNDPNTGSKYVMAATGAFGSWTASISYDAGDYVINGGSVYVAIAGGTSAISGGPTGTAASIPDGPDTLVWAYVPPSLAPAWQGGHSYSVGQYVTNRGTFYQVKTSGWSSLGGPTGTAASIPDGPDTLVWAYVPSNPPAWQASHVYTAVGDYASNDGGKVYVVTVAGTSANSGGPTGTAASIPDGPNTLVWAYVPSSAPAWQPDHAYAGGTYASHVGNLYVVTTAGTSGHASTGPTGTGATIGDGTVVWASVTVPSYTPLANGENDSLVPGGSLDTELAAVFATPSPFDPIPIQLLACPETSKTSVVQAALTYCSNRGDCMFVGHVPDYGPQPVAAAKAYGQGLQGDKVYGALYLPYIQVVDPIGSLIWIPPTGHVLGVYARTDQQRGIWKAPAGDGAIVRNALAVRATLNDTDHTDLVKNGSVNAIRPITGAGIVIDSSRTLSTNTLWLYVNVRLLFNFVKTSLKLGLRWVVQEPNDATLWNKIKFNSVTPFLMGLWRLGAFGSGKPSDVFTVKVDSINNPAANVQQGILNVEVYFYPSRPAETIVITVGQQQGASTATES